MIYYIAQNTFMFLNGFAWNPAFNFQQITLMYRFKFFYLVTSFFFMVLQIREARILSNTYDALFLRKKLEKASS